MSGVAEANLTNAAQCSDVTTAGRLLQHLKEPQNLLMYMAVVAFSKYMGISALVPTIVIA